MSLTAHIQAAIGTIAALRGSPTITIDGAPSAYVCVFNEHAETASLEAGGFKVNFDAAVVLSKLVLGGYSPVRGKRCSISSMAGKRYVIEGINQDEMQVRLRLVEVNA